MTISTAVFTPRAFTWGDKVRHVFRPVKMVPSVFAWKCGIPPNGNFTREHVDTLRDFLGTVPWGTQFHLNHYVYKRI